jgi:hypothetical protein
MRYQKRSELSLKEPLELIGAIANAYDLKAKVMKLKGHKAVLYLEPTSLALRAWSEGNASAGVSSLRRQGRRARGAGSK